MSAEIDVFNIFLVIKRNRTTTEIAKNKTKVIRADLLDIYFDFEDIYI